MFGDVLDLWKQFRAKRQAAWGPADPRRDLANEVQVRLRQLDIALEYVQPLAERLQPDREQFERDMRWQEKALLLVRRGEMTEAEFVAGLPPGPTREEIEVQLKLFAEVEFFTEAFYFVAWRLVEILNRSSPLGFSSLGPVKARGVRDVRNQLIEHPEGTSRLFQRSMRIAGDGRGPALKTLPEGSIDRGLFVNAQELHDELARRLDVALALPS